uniref:Uncharacterized protein n=1 Tax=Pelusios castaneus TaxID=367368 RepID=A0A8C8S080_9SAUR
VVALLLAVQRLLDHQLRELGTIAARLDVQREEAVVVAGEQVSAQPVVAGVRVVGAGEREARARRGVLRDVHVHLVGGEGGRVVVQVLDLHLDHADLLVVGEDLERQLALGAAAAERLAVDALLGVEQPVLAVHVQQVRRRVLQHAEGRLGAPAAAPLRRWRRPAARPQPGIPPDVADHRARPLLLRHRVVQVLQSQGGSPAEEEATNGKVHPRAGGGGCDSARAPPGPLPPPPYSLLPAPIPNPSV